MKKIILLLAIGLLNTAAHATVTFVNLDKQSVRVARYYYTDGNEPPYSEQGWVFKGWSRIEGGGIHKSNSNHFYLENRANDQQIRWNGLQDSIGFVKDNESFEKHWPKGASPRRMTDAGFKQVKFQTFGNTLYTIGGDTYRIAEKDIPYSFESRGILFINESFKVNGEIIDFSVTGSNTGGNVSVDQPSENTVRVHGSIEGWQNTPGAARVKARATGTIHVKYVGRR